MTPGNNVIEVVLQLVDNVTKPLSGITSSFGKLSGLIGLAIGGWSLGKLIANITEADQVAAKLDNAFKNLGKNAGVTRQGLDELAASIQSTTTFDDESVKRAEAVLLTFTKVTGDTFEKTMRVAADMSAALGRDLTSSVMMLGRAMQDPQIGMMMLRRSGVALTAQQREMIKEMVKAGDTIGAQEKILELLDQRYKDSAATMRGTLSGAFQALQNQIGDMMEGDRDSFPGVVAAVEELIDVLKSPGIKDGFDTLIGGLMQATEWAIKAAAAIGRGAKVTAEYFAALAAGGTPGYGTDPLPMLYGQRDRIKKELAEINPLADWTGRADKLRAELKVVETQIASTHDEYIKLQRALSVVGTVESATGGEKKFDLEALVARGQKLQDALRTDVEKTADTVSEEIVNIARLYQEEFSKPGSTGFDLKEIDEMVSGLQKMLDGAVGKAADGAKKIDRAFADGLRGIEVTAEAVGDDATTALFRAMDEATQTGFERQVAAWHEFLAEIDELRQRGSATGGISEAEAEKRIAESRQMIAPLGALEQVQQTVGVDVDEAAINRAIEQIRLLGVEIAKLYEFSDEDLLKLGTTRAELDEAIAGLSEMVDKTLEANHEVSESGLQAARNIQTFFADAFMSIGHGWEGTVKSFIDGFKRIIAEAGALQLAKAIGLDRILEGKPSTGGAGKLLERIFPSRKPSRVAEEDRGVDARKVVETVRPGGAATTTAVSDCAASCAGQVAGQVGESMSKTVGASLKEFGGGILDGIRTITGGLWKFITGTLGKIWDFIKTVAASIRAMATSSSTSSGGGIFGTIGGFVDSIFGAAGGGRAPAYRPLLVGEDGPELGFPAGPVRTAKAVLGALGGAIGNYAGGGRAPADRLHVVGENGPEVIFPLVPLQVVNARQLAFAGIGGSAGGGRIAAGRPRLVGEEGLEILSADGPRQQMGVRQLAYGGASVGGQVKLEFKPEYSIVINGAKDDHAIFAAIAAYIEKQDQKNKVEIMDMLRRNGYGRMQRS